MTNTTTMTTREFLNAVINGEISDKEISKAKEMLAFLDKRNESRKSADSKEKKEVAERRSLVLAFLKENRDTVFSRDEIALAIEDNKVSASQASSACGQFVKDGLVNKSTVKVGKATKVVYQYVGE